MKFVASLEGVHGCGKTTVFRRLQEMKAEWFFLPEFIDPPRYPFGSKDKQTAFRAELWVLQQMLKRKTLLEQINSGVVVCDRSPICVVAYAYALCSDEDYQLIKDFYKSVNWGEDVIFYFEETVESVLPKIRARKGRPKEWNEDDAEYIARILEGYEEALKLASCPVLRIKNSDVEKVSSRIAVEIEKAASLLSTYNYL